MYFQTKRPGPDARNIVPLKIVPSGDILTLHASSGAAPESAFHRRTASVTHQVINFRKVVRHFELRSNRRLWRFKWKRCLEGAVLDGGEGGIRTPGTTRAHVISSHAGSARLPNLSATPPAFMFAPIQSSNRRSRFFFLSPLSPEELCVSHFVGLLSRPARFLAKHAARDHMHDTKPAADSRSK
jgi:hypothetical protein